ncbi:MAG: hypothetical protein V1913_18805 [Fibrobacterota bacterium]
MKHFLIPALTALIIAFTGCCSTPATTEETNAEKSEKAAKEAVQELDKELQQ